MIKELRPKTPRDNPPLRSGIYDAVVDQVLEGIYGDDDSPMIRIVFRIPSENAYFCTHIYFPGNYAPGSRRRLWHFCQCAGLAIEDIEWYPELFSERALRVRIIHNTPTTASPYSDVQSFLPATSENHDPKIMLERIARSDWITPLGDVV